MKKVTAFIGTQTKKATYRAVQEFEKNLKQYGDIDFEYVFLSEYNLEFCRGCKVCFDKGEEHCPLKDDRDILLEKMEQWARKRIVITVPNGYVWQDDYDDNPFQEHRSGWSADDLRNLGFEVSGLLGWRRLRGYRGTVKYRPTFMWTRASAWSQRVAKHCPELAFWLLAVKRVDEGNG